MARLRKFVCYRRVERANTRISKYKKHAFVKGSPPSKLSKFEMGDKTGKYDVILHLVPEMDLQIRHNALESARMSSNRVLETALGKNYFYQIKVYPFHVLRENPLASGAGADRFSTGMSHAFGKPIGVAAQIKKGQPIFELRVNKKDIKLAKGALQRAAYKLPCKCRIC